MSADTTSPIPNQVPAAQSDEISAQLENIAKEIERLQGTAICKIAEHLAKARDLFRYRRDEGGFAGWVETRLNCSRDTAYNLVHVHERFGGKSVEFFRHFAPSVLYLLAAPSMPEAAREEIIARAEGGEKFTVDQVKNIRARASASGQSPPKTRMSKAMALAIRKERLGEETCARIADTSLGKSVEMNALLELRGADKQQAEALISHAEAGAPVSAIAVVAAIKQAPNVQDAVIAYLQEHESYQRRETQARAMQDVGENSRGETERLRVCVDEQANEIQRLKKENIGLRCEIEELHKTYSQRLLKLPKPERATSIKQLLVDVDVVVADLAADQFPHPLDIPPALRRANPTTNELLATQFLDGRSGREL